MSMRTRIAEQRSLYVARRSMAGATTAYPNQGGSESASESASEPAAVTLRSVAGPVRTALPEASQPANAFPVWFAALMASSCRANANGQNHAIRWDCISGRAVYTNRGGDAEHIEPLGVSLKGGQTLAVYWMPGETAYTVEVYPQSERCA